MVEACWSQKDHWPLVQAAGAVFRPSSGNKRAISDISRNERIEEWLRDNKDVKW